MVSVDNEKTNEKNLVIKKKRGRKPKKKVENSDLIEDNSKLLDSENVVIKKKRGRKPKKKPEESDPLEVKIPKKRGRKPKGGKIISTPEKNNVIDDVMPNIILHLKCKNTNYDNNMLSSMSYNPDISIPESYNIENTSKLNKYSYEIIDSSTEESLKHVCSNSDNFDSDLSYNKNLTDTNNKELWSKLKELQTKLHTNDISDKQSACFWCTFSFNNPAIFIPKFYINDHYEVYGCFCTPECAVAHLMNENIDSSIKFERYQFINHIYGEIYNYENNIKPAPNPHYLLDKFYGNLSIAEYRKLLNRESLILIVDKPLTRVMPELYEDNSEIKTNVISDKKFSLKRTVKKKNKSNIMTENFGFNN